MLFLDSGLRGMPGGLVDRAYCTVGRTSRRMSTNITCAACSHEQRDSSEVSSGSDRREKDVPGLLTAEDVCGGQRQGSSEPSGMTCPVVIRDCDAVGCPAGASLRPVSMGLG